MYNIIHLLILTMLAAGKLSSSWAQMLASQQQMGAFAGQGAGASPMISSLPMNPSMGVSGEYRMPARTRLDYLYSNPELAEERTRLMYPYDGFLTDISSGKPIHDQSLQFRLPFFGFSYEYIWIQRDGYIAFNKGMQTYRFPLKLPIQPADTFVQEDPAILAPFFAMQDISPDIPGSGVYFRIVNMADTRLTGDQEYNLIRSRIQLDFSTGMIGSLDFSPKWAMIVTWANMTMANRRSERPLRTNTYQAVIATDEIRTYAMFNYEQIDWITHLDNYDGLKGSAAFVGFNAGNTTRSFEFKPYSQHQRVSMLPAGGFGNGLTGRYLFQVDEEIWPGSCIVKALEPNLRDRLPLTFFPRYGHMLGGTLVDVTGPCLDPSSIIYCRFDNFKSEAIYRSRNHATCISPAFMYHGYVDLTISVDDKIEFVGRFYVQPPEVAEDDVIVLDSRDREEAPEELELKWHPQKLSWFNDTWVTISLWGYRETMNVYPQLVYITTLVEKARLDQSTYRLDLNQFRDRDDGSSAQDLLFGFIAVNLTNPQLIAPRMRQSPIIWSRPMPLSWYFRSQWLRTIGENYKDYFCRNWYEREASADRFAATLWRCPCTLAQVDIDRGRFSPDLQCNIIDRRCDTFHREALHCVNTGRPSIGGSGQTCCYDDQGELIQTADTIYGGRPSRAFVYGKHPFKIRMMIPSLSSWVHDVAPFFYCCQWQKKKDNAEACQNYNQFRSSQDCSLYQPPVIGSVYGDPHLITFNKNNYTFNGKGEYVLVHSDDPKVKFDVQARFEPVPRQMRHMRNIRATHLTAVAAQDNFSSIVEFRIRPLAARWRYHIYVLVDNEYVFWWDKSMQVQNFRGVTLYQPAGIQNMSHIIAMFDSGAGVEVQSIDGYMTTHVYLPPDFQGITSGLLGNYTRYPSQAALGDLVSPMKQRFSSRQPMEQLHQFGQDWRLTEADRRGVGHTLFSHSAVRYALYDDPNFVPQFRFDSLPGPNNPLQGPDSISDAWFYDTPERLAEMQSICSDSASCIFDYKASFGNKELALATKRFEAIAFELANTASMEIVRCPALPKPANGMKSENRYWPGKVVRFSCDVGYRLVGYEARFCREDGLWSWGEEPQCISEWRYFSIMFGSILAALLPMAVTIAAGVFCLIFMVRRSRAHSRKGDHEALPVRARRAGSSEQLDANDNPAQELGLDDEEEEEEAEDSRAANEMRAAQSGAYKPILNRVMRRSPPATGSGRPFNDARSERPPIRQALAEPEDEIDEGDFGEDEVGDLDEDLSHYNDRRAPTARPDFQDDEAELEAEQSGDDDTTRLTRPPPTVGPSRAALQQRAQSPARPFRPMSTRNLFDLSNPSTGPVYMPTTQPLAPRGSSASSSALRRGQDLVASTSGSALGLPLRPKQSSLRRQDYGPLREARI